MTESYLSQKVSFQVKSYYFIFYSICCILLVAAVSSARASQIRNIESRQTLYEQKLAELDKELQKTKERFNHLISVVSSCFLRRHRKSSAQIVLPRIKEAMVSIYIDPFNKIG